MAELIKGPWTREGETDWSVDTGGSNSYYFIFDTDGNVAAVIAVDSAYHKDEELEAKASLVEAAPEMFEALKLAGPQLEVLHRHYSGPDAAAIYKIIGVVSSAISKAEGRS